MSIYLKATKLIFLKWKFEGDIKSFIGFINSIFPRYLGEIEIPVYAYIEFVHKKQGWLSIRGSRKRQIIKSFMQGKLKKKDSNIKVNCKK